LEILLVFIALILAVSFFIFNGKKYKVKNTAVKKEEIIAQYENSLQQILKKYENDKSKQIEEKKLFLQKCNSELSRNIFFTHEESIKIIERLLKI